MKYVDGRRRKAFTKGGKMHHVSLKIVYEWIVKV